MENALFHSTVRHFQDAFTFLLSFFPISDINTAVVPVHFAVAVSLIANIMTVISIATFPVEYTEAVFAVISKFTFILVAIWLVSILFPFATTRFYTIGKVTLIIGSTAPLINARSIRLTLHISSSKRVSICKDISALPMFQSINIFAFISISIEPMMNTIAFYFTVAPLTYIRFSINALPNAKAMLMTLMPLTIVDFTVVPSVNSFSLSSVL